MYWLKSSIDQTQTRAHAQTRQFGIKSIESVPVLRAPLAVQNATHLLLQQPATRSVHLPVCQMHRLRDLGELELCDSCQKWLPIFHAGCGIHN